MFSVDKLTGKITTDRYLGKQTKLYELSVTATDQISHKTDTCKVKIYLPFKVDYCSKTDRLYSFHVSVLLFFMLRCIVEIS